MLPSHVSKKVWEGVFWYRYLSGRNVHRIPCRIISVSMDTDMPLKCSGVWLKTMGKYLVQVLTCPSPLMADELLCQQRRNQARDSARMWAEDPELKTTTGLQSLEQALSPNPAVSFRTGGFAVFTPAGHACSLSQIPAVFMSPAVPTCKRPP